MNRMPDIDILLWVEFKSSILSCAVSRSTLRNSSSPGLHAKIHYTPYDTYMIIISGRTPSASVTHIFRFRFFYIGFRCSHWFSNYSAHPWHTRAPSKNSKRQNYNFRTYSCKHSVSRQLIVFAVMTSTACNRINRGEPPTSPRLRTLQI